MRTMVDAIRAELDKWPISPTPFTGGQPEQMIVWRRRADLCRALIDWLHDDHATIDDLKTTAASAHYRDWTRRTMWTIGAAIQARFYQRGVKAVYGVEPEFRFVVVENTPPYALSVVDLSPAAVALADAQIDQGLKVWRDCLASGDWPAYPRMVASAEPPGWMEADWLERGVIV